MCVRVVVVVVFRRVILIVYFKLSQRGEPGQLNDVLFP